MVSISKACQILGVARSTLLYYERMGMVTPKRNPDNGYREYSQKDMELLLMVRQLKQAGFTLKESMAVMKGALDPDLLLARYNALCQEIEAMTMAKEVVKSLLVSATGELPPGDVAGRRGQNWHAEFEQQGAEAHFAWLKRLGFSEKESLYIRWVTRNISNGGQYMENFFKIFEQMKRQGPGSRESTLRAFKAIPRHREIKAILEVGCGKGESSLALAQESDALITAVDNHQPFLDHLADQAARLGLDGQITTKNMSMFDLDFPRPGFDLVWAEGSAYFMGFEKALTEWRPLINRQGFLFVSDAVWLTDQPSQACADYWKIEYPTMTDVKTRKAQAREQGYEISSWFILPRQDWQAFYDDMEACSKRAVKEMGMTRTFEDFIREIELDRTHGEEYGYLCLLLQRKD
ncbi:MAG: MerR family transcriptional regulator [Desulfobacteraceae bacterium]|nr:MerR family transcriptional regulator [Desulfobacteraceae bacterium]